MVAEKKKLLLQKHPHHCRNFSVRIAVITFKAVAKKIPKKNPLNSKIDISLQVISQNPDHIHPKNLFVHGD